MYHWYHCIVLSHCLLSQGRGRHSSIPPTPPARPTPVGGSTRPRTAGIPSKRASAARVPRHQPFASFSPCTYGTPLQFLSRFTCGHGARAKHSSSGIDTAWLHFRGHLRPSGPCPCENGGVTCRGRAVRCAASGPLPDDFVVRRMPTPIFSIIRPPPVPSAGQNDPLDNHSQDTSPY